MIEKLYFNSDHKKYVGKIIDEVLAQQYPNKAESISLEELLDWDMWQTFIKIHSTLFTMTTYQ